MAQLRFFLIVINNSNNNNTYIAPISILLFSAFNSSMESFSSQRVMMYILYDIRIKNQTT